MTDFVSRVLRPEKGDWAVRSLLDMDYYKFTMDYFIWMNYPGVEVEFCLINRNHNLPLAKLIDEQELRAHLNHVRTLRFGNPNPAIAMQSTNIYYLRGMDVYGTRMFPEEYLKFLATMEMTPYTLERVGDQYKLKFKGPWEVVTFWETIALAIVCELLYRKLMRSMTKAELEALYAAAKIKLDRKLRLLKARPGIKFADFGQRRRHSFLWQKYAIEVAREIMGPQFTGTSNTWMAFNQDLVPIGTNAHELPMVLTAIASPEEYGFTKKHAQYEVLRKWGATFPHNALRIVLPDTYGSAQFWRDMPKDLAKEIAETWRGEREDSGDPVTGALAFTRWLDCQGIDKQRILREKIVIPSDGLDVDSMISIDKALDGTIAHPFGWGTNFSNGFEGCHPRANEMAVVDGVELGLTWGQLFKGQSVVIKVESANGKPAVKLSNNIKKATGNPEEVKKYIGIFGTDGQVSQDVSV